VFQVVSFTQFPHQNPVPISPHPPYKLKAPDISLFDTITRGTFDEEWRSLSSSLCSLLQSLVTASLLGPNIYLSTLLSNTHSLCGFLWFWLDSLFFVLVIFLVFFFLLLFFLLLCCIVLSEELVCFHFTFSLKED
jgi:hypothetical protein